MGSKDDRNWHNSELFKFKGKITPAAKVKFYLHGNKKNSFKEIIWKWSKLTADTSGKRSNSIRLPYS